MTHEKLKRLHKLLSEYSADLRSGPVGKSDEAEPLAANMLSPVLTRIKYEIADSAPDQYSTKNT
jgi:hypothetical protein